MIEDGLFSVNCGNAENLRAISVDAAKLCEKRLLELREVAEGLSSIAMELMSEGLSPLEAVSSVGEPDSPVYESHPFCLPENLHGVESFLSCVSDFDKAALCMLLPEALAEGGRAIRETDLLDCAPSEETVCYVRNAFSDEAFDVFSEGFSDPRVKYRASFKECASAVSDGQCGYLLLPLEVIEPIQKLKISNLGNRNPRLHADEILIALAIAATTDPVAAHALEQIPKLRGCEAHASVIPSSVDRNVYRKLGMNLTCSPVYEAKKLYHK